MFPCLPHKLMYFMIGCLSLIIRNTSLTSVDTKCFHFLELKAYGVQQVILMLATEGKDKAIVNTNCQQVMMCLCNLKYEEIPKRQAQARPIEQNSFLVGPVLRTFCIHTY